MARGEGRSARDAASRLALADCLGSRFSHEESGARGRRTSSGRFLAGAVHLPHRRPQPSRPLPLVLAGADGAAAPRPGTGSRGARSRTAGGGAAADGRGGVDSRRASSGGRRVPRDGGADGGHQADQVSGWPRRPSARCRRRRPRPRRPAAGRRPHRVEHAGPEARARPPNTRRAYSGALGRLDAWLDGRRHEDATLAAVLATCQRPWRRGRGGESDQVTI